MVRARYGAPLVKGNSHEIEINAIGHVRAPGDEVSPIRMTRRRESSLSL
jgi:hypothetical protein